MNLCWGYKEFFSDVKNGTPKVSCIILWARAINQAVAGATVLHLETIRKVNKILQGNCLVYHGEPHN